MRNKLILIMLFVSVMLAENMKTLPIVKANSGDWIPFMTENTDTLYRSTMQTSVYDVLSDSLLSSHSVRVLLPDTLSAVVGDTLQLFYRGIVEAPNPYNYHLTISSTKGQMYSRYYEYVPLGVDTVGNYYPLIARVYNDQYKLLAADTACIKVQAAWQPTVNNIMIVGDSFTENGTWVTEFYRRLTGTGGTPAGKAFTGITTVGNLGVAPNQRIGFGGQTWSFYTTKTAVSGTTAITTTNVFWFFGTHSKTSPADLNQILQDSNGNKWKIDSLKTGKLACTAFVSGITAHLNEPPASGTLTYVSGGTNIDNVTYTDIERTVRSDGNPLWDYAGTGINFTKYCTRNSISDIDVVVAMMTWNEIETNKILPSAYDYRMTNVMTFLDALHSAYPNAKVIIAPPQNPPAYSGLCSEYLMSVDYGYYFGKVRGVFTYNIAVRNLAMSAAYKSFVTYCPMILGFDNENGYNTTVKKLNLRDVTPYREIIQTGGIHPSTYGYYQLADVVYREFVRLFCK